MALKKISPWRSKWSLWRMTFLKVLLRSESEPLIRTDCCLRSATFSFITIIMRSRLTIRIFLFLNMIAYPIKSRIADRVHGYREITNQSGARKDVWSGFIYITADRMGESTCRSRTRKVIASEIRVQIKSGDNATVGRRYYTRPRWLNWISLIARPPDRRLKRLSQIALITRLHLSYRYALENAV